MELWMAVLGLALLVGGILIGVFYGRYHSGVVKQAETLQTQLDESKGKFEAYEQDVNNHFRTTAELVNAMTASYRAVYEHLAASSAKLCPNEPSMLRLAEPTENLLKQAEPVEVPNNMETSNSQDVDPPLVTDTATQAEAPAAEAVVDQRIYH